MKYGFDPTIDFKYEAAVHEMKDRILLLQLESSPLIKAAALGNLDIFKILLEHGCDINTQGYICDFVNSAYETNVLGAAVSQLAFRQGTCITPS